MSVEASALCDTTLTLRGYSQQRILRSDGEQRCLSLSEVFDILLLEVGFVLWYEQVSRWNVRDLAWTSEDMIVEAIRYYLLGQNVGSTPIFDGICSFCGALLYGYMNTKEMGNKCNGVPVNINGSSRSKNGKNVSVNSQPPFLLRWSPEQLQAFAPDVFEFNPFTHKLDFLIFIFLDHLVGNNLFFVIRNN